VLLCPGAAEKIRASGQRYPTPDLEHLYVQKDIICGNNDLAIAAGIGL